LHDGTGQELTGLSLFAGTLSEILSGATHGEMAGKTVYHLEEADYLQLQQTASRLSQGLTQANRNVHELCHGIMPVQIDAEGLRSALEELAAATDAQKNTACRFECPDPVAVTNNTTATHLYRIAQEALHNALRHSQADQIQVSLSQQDGQIILEVRDNGVGIDPAASRRATATAGGMGLRTMDYRAGMIGGVLRVERNEPKGTLVSCTVPRGANSQ
jgi:two-component system sensor kinase FixL